MRTLIEVSPGEPLPAVAADAGVGPITIQEQQHRPDRHLVLADGSLRARASCWWTDVPKLPGQQLGVIGHYAAATPQDGAEVLAGAAACLRRAGCTAAVGPMDGNTWRRYRLVIERGGEPPFFLEPDNPDEYVDHFTASGFATLATYTSALTDDLAMDSASLPGRERRLRDAGISVRPLDIARADDDLRRIYRLSLETFSNNYLYTPIEEDEFLEQNRRVLPAVVPDLVLLAERDGALVGFLFGVPDVLQRQRVSSIDTFIVKTVAVAPSAAGAGLGGTLVALAQARARELGFTRAIHALMHEQNLSQRISRHYARTIRRYALFWRDLGAASGANVR